MLSPEHGVGAPIRAKYEPLHPSPIGEPTHTWERDLEGYGLSLPIDTSGNNGEVPQRFR